MKKHMHLLSLLCLLLVGGVFGMERRSGGGKLGSLPHDILHQIFNFYSDNYGAILRRLMLVNKHFRVCIKYPAILPLIRIKFSRSFFNEDENCWDYLCGTSCIMQMWGIIKKSDSFFERRVKTLKAFLGKGRKVRLDFSCADFIDDKQLGCVLEACKDSVIVGLNLKGCENIGDFSFLKTLSNLKELNLMWTEITAEDMKNLSETVEKLNLNECEKIYDFSFLSRFVNLKELSLDDTYVTEKELMWHLPKAVKRIWLRERNYITDEFVDKLKSKCSCLEIKV